MNDRCGVLLELALVSFPVAQQLVQGGNYNSLQLQLIDGPRMAFMYFRQSSVFLAKRLMDLVMIISISPAIRYRFAKKYHWKCTFFFSKIVVFR